MGKKWSRQLQGRCIWVLIIWHQQFPSAAATTVTPHPIYAFVKFSHPIYAFVKGVKIAAEPLEGRRAVDGGEAFHIPQTYASIPPKYEIY